VVRAATVGDLEEGVEQYATAARLCRERGLDRVVIRMAHGAAARGVPVAAHQPARRARPAAPSDGRATTLDAVRALTTEVTGRVVVCDTVGASTSAKGRASCRCSR
jgi:hypothetical protein